jgi:GntR family histidine utilization transcriptional repressor
MTVSKVLTGLANAGLIERRRRAGSFVSSPRAHSAVLEIPDIKSAIISRGEEYQYELLSKRKRASTRKDSEHLLLKGKTNVVDIHCRHLANGVPFAVEERLINLAEVPEASDVDFSVTPPGTWLLAFVPWLEAENKILASQAGPAWGELLKLPEAAACLIVERRTWRTGSALTWVRQIFRGDKYYLSARFTPS